MGCSGDTPHLDNASSEYITIGKITGSFGKSGAVKIQILTDFPERFFSGEDIFLFSRDAAPEKIKVTDAFYHKNFIVAKISVSGTMDKAKEFVNAELKITSSRLKKLDKNYYYQFNITGLDVYDTDNNYIGKVKNIIDNSCNDVYVVFNETNKKEILIPAIGRYVKKVDLENKKMIIEEPEYTDDK